MDALISLSYSWQCGPISHEIQFALHIQIVYFTEVSAFRSLNSVSSCKLFSFNMITQLFVCKEYSELRDIPNNLIRDTKLGFFGSSEFELTYRFS